MWAEGRRQIGQTESETRQAPTRPVQALEQVHLLECRYQAELSAPPPHVVTSYGLPGVSVTSGWAVLYY